MSSGFHLVTGNHLETLAQALAGLFCEQTDPFLPEIVLVQSKGMQRWVSLEIARANGICANIQFPFPNTFVDMLYRDICAPLPEKRLFDRTLMTFRILEDLPELLDSPVFSPLRIYLATQRHPMKAYQLALRISDAFDQYLVFRPEMIAHWEQGNDMLSAEGQSWQPVLWRHLRRLSAEPHRADLQRHLIDRLDDAKNDLKLPKRVALFGISHLPRFHLAILQALSQRIPVYLFLLNPCRHYWFDILSDRQISNRREKTAAIQVDSEDMHFERGNRLLASWGQIGKHFFNAVYQIQDQSTELFLDNEKRTLLGAVQRDVLDLIDRSDSPDSINGNADTADEDADVGIHETDGSIRIHTCHNPMRELQVLHDQLLDMLDRDTTLHPRDILVLMPDIVEYAPYIHAVFGTARPRIPFSIADQTLTRENRIAEGFIRILQLSAERFEASKVIGLLEYPAIRERFGLEAADLPVLERWTETANIRWGWDGRDRQKYGLPGFRENTWQFGLERLLLGYAMDGGDRSLFAGIAPVNAVEGNDSVLLGGFTEFCEALHEHLSQIPQQMHMGRWGVFFQGILDRFFVLNESTASVFQEIRDILTGFSDIVQVAGCTAAVTYDVAMGHLVDQLDARINSAGFLAGRVTFCAMLPMRSIPAKVVCLLGLNHDAFPKESHEPGFNLVALDPRPGDRSRRNDDKYLFLEAIVSARDVFYLSYIGKNIQDNATIPPSVLVEEFIDYIVENYAIRRRDLVVDHPLHAFSPRYFNSSERSLFSYSEENLLASRQLSEAKKESPFFIEPLPPIEKEAFLDLDRLIRFFANPCRFLLEERLGLHLDASIKTIPDRELFRLDPLNQYFLNQQLLESYLEGTPLADSFKVVRASGNLPHGSAGKAAYQQSCSLVSSFESTLSMQIPDDQARRIRFCVHIDACRLEAVLEGIHDECFFAYRMAKKRPKDLLSFYLSFLALSASVHGAPVKRGVFVFQNETWEFQKPSDALPLLASFLEIYRQGMRLPLPFFSRTSHTFADFVLNRSSSREAALHASRQAWEGTDFSKGEKEDPYHARCYSQADPFTERFEETALAVWTPLFEVGRKLPANH